MAEKKYDLVLKGGRVIDPKNKIDGAMDVATKDGKIAAVAKDIPTAEARKAIDVAGFYVVPGLIDLHIHCYGYMGSLHPDGFTFPDGTTTVVDAGGAGWRTFEDFKNKVIAPTGETPPTKTRVLALLNIVGAGMVRWMEQNPRDMDPIPCAEMVKRYPDIIVGIKTAHYGGPDWVAVDGAVKAGELSGTPAMFDISIGKYRSCEELFDHLRPGDIRTHCYNWQYGSVVGGKVSPAYIAGRKKGIIFDVGHGAGSFCFKFGVPAIQQGFWPDVISTDLHWASRLIPQATMLPTMSKFLNLGIPLPEVIRLSTVAPAQVISRPELGNLSVGACADIAVLALREGDFGFVDSNHAKMKGRYRLEGLLTVRAGEVVWDLNGISWPDWKSAGDYGRIGQYDSF